MAPVHRHVVASSGQQRAVATAITDQFRGPVDHASNLPRSGLVQRQTCPISGLLSGGPITSKPFAGCADLFALSGAPRRSYRTKSHVLVIFRFSRRFAEAGRIEAFLQGLRDLGYLEEKTITIEWRWAMAKQEITGRGLHGSYPY